MSYELPSIEPRQLTLTYERPHMLVSRDGDRLTVHQGKRLQLEHEIEEGYSNEPVQEEPFRVLAQNTIAFAGASLTVINDESPGLPASRPSAAEYLSKVGQRTLVAFRCTADPHESERAGRTVYRIYRAFATLP